jgi:hypothetical protein
MIKVLSLDPGVTTGYTLALVGDNKVRIHYQQAELTVSELYHSINVHDPDYLICEDFEYRPGKALPSLVLFSVQLIGICNLWDQQRTLARHSPPTYRRLFIQKASTGKAYFDDEKLMLNELYIKGLPHGRDSLRHFLQWLNFGWGYQLIEEAVNLKYELVMNQDEL